MSTPVQTVHDFLVYGSDTAFKEGSPTVLALDNGQFDIAWDQDRTKVVWYDTDVDIARVNADGSAANGGAVIVPKAPIDNAESQGALATLGTLQAVAFVDRANPYTDGAIRLNLYNSGSFRGSDRFYGESLVVDESAGGKFNPAVVALGEGRLAVSYVDGGSDAVKVRIYDAAVGGFIAPSITISDEHTGASARQASYDLGMTALASGDFATTWRGADDATHIRVIDADGAFLSKDVIIGPALDKTSVAEVGNGRLAVVTSGEKGLHFVSFDTHTGFTPATVDLGVAGTDATVTALDDGRLFVAWANKGDILGALLNADGKFDSTVFTVAANDDVLGRPSLATLADGRVAVSYADATKGGIYASIFDPREEGVNLHGTKGADQFVGTGFSDHFYMGSGNDTVTGGGGNDYFDGGKGADTMTGGRGNDVYVIDNVKDVVVEAANGGIDTVKSSSVSIELGSLDSDIENATLTGSRNLSLNGTAGANVLIGNSGNNMISGADGADTLIGGAGNDTYFFASSNDRIVELKGGGYDQILLGGQNYTLGAGVEVELIQSVPGKVGVTLTGNEFGQTLIGGNFSPNFLDGKGGMDTLVGGNRGDFFNFTTALGAGNVDHIVSFGTATALPYLADNDTIHLSASIFKAITPGTLSADAFTANADGVAKDASDRIVYETDTGNLYYDSNGSASGGSVLFAVLDSKPAALFAGDFVIG